MLSEDGQVSLEGKKPISFLFFKIIYLSVCAGSSLLCGLFASCSEQELLSGVVCGLLIAVTSLVGL